MSAHFSHIFMLVSDLTAARRLFVDVIGLRVLADEGEYLAIGGDEGFRVGMEQGSADSCEGTEINILVDDLDSAHTRLVQAGVTVEGPPQEQPWGRRHVWFHDIDGRRMSVFSRT
jgi:catechol 2,3-dioxygenase-like lactoylglutathione lyase family enzyme